MKGVLTCWMGSSLALTSFWDISRPSFSIVIVAMVAICSCPTYSSNMSLRSHTLIKLKIPSRGNHKYQISSLDHMGRSQSTEFAGSDSSVGYLASSPEHKTGTARAKADALILGEALVYYLRRPACLVIDARTHAASQRTASNMQSMCMGN